jgi:DNA (cytosine-5)-methyltransferase 1
VRGIDLFCGARGWEARAHKSLGVDLLGVEYWEPAVLTSRAAGLRVLHADVSELDPSDFAGEVGDDGIMAGSPPCPTFSAAGRGSGKHLTGVLLDCARAMMDGRDTREAARAEAYAILLPVALEAERKRAVKAKRAPDEGKAQTSARRDAVMSVLVVEPLRFALALRPRAILLEQVPSVLPLWKAFGAMLSERGYSWWAGVLEAERFGVPQTRERAVLIARRDGVAAHPPTPTHHRFVPNEPRPDAEESLFGTVLPWVSMAEALGWDDTGTRSRSTRDGGVIVNTRGNRRTSGGNEFSADGPSIALTEKTRSWHLRNNSQPNAAVRTEDEPAPAMFMGHDAASRVWVTNHDRPERVEAGAGNHPRSGDQPAVTIDTTARQAEWVNDRPATNVNGDPRISAPGHDDPAQSGSQQANAVRVTVEQAAILQSFPADWPWQGSRTAQFTQVGNAVPPLLGEALLRTVAEGRERPT